MNNQFAFPLAFRFCISVCLFQSAFLPCYYLPETTADSPLQLCVDMIVEHSMSKRCPEAGFLQVTGDRPLIPAPFCIDLNFPSDHRCIGSDPTKTHHMVVWRFQHHTEQNGLFSKCPT